MPPVPADHCVRTFSLFDLLENLGERSQVTFPSWVLHGTPGSMLLTPVLCSLKLQVICGEKGGNETRHGIESIL